MVSEEGGSSTDPLYWPQLTNIGWEDHFEKSTFSSVANTKAWGKDKPHKPCLVPFLKLKPKIISFSEMIQNNISP